MNNTDTNTGAYNWIKKIIASCKRGLLKAVYGSPIRGESIHKKHEAYPPAMPFDNISYYQWTSKEWKNHFNQTKK